MRRHWLEILAMVMALGTGHGVACAEEMSDSTIITEQWRNEGEKEVDSTTPADDTLESGGLTKEEILRQRIGEDKEIIRQRAEAHREVVKKKAEKHIDRAKKDPFLKRIKKFFAVDSNYIYKPKQKMAAGVHNQLYLDFISFEGKEEDQTEFGLDMRSPVRYNLGFSFSYRPITLSYFLHINQLANYDISGIQRLRLHLLNSRFLFDATYFRDNGKQYIAKYKLGEIKKKFNDVTFEGYEFNYLNAELDWFLNYRRYAPSATTSCSSIQKRSAGSFIVGLSYSYQDFSADCTLLPDTVNATFPVGTKVTANSHNFCVDLGYAHNFTFWKHFTFNITLLPKVGLKRYFQNNDGVKYFIALNPSADVGLVYNHSRFFVNLHLHADLLYNLQNDQSLVAALTDHRVSVGVRF